MIKLLAMTAILLLGCQEAKHARNIVEEVPVYIGYGVFSVSQGDAPIVVQIAELKRRFPECTVTAITHLTDWREHYIVNFEGCELRNQRMARELP